MSDSRVSVLYTPSNSPQLSPIVILNSIILIIYTGEYVLGSEEAAEERYNSKQRAALNEDYGSFGQIYLINSERIL